MQYLVVEVPGLFEKSPKRSYGLQILVDMATFGDWDFLLVQSLVKTVLKVGTSDLDLGKVTIMTDDSWHMDRITHQQSVQ